MSSDQSAHEIPASTDDGGAEPEDRFEPAGPGSLADRGELLDEDGDDIREYTGEPVETEEGWVLPQQQNLAGKDNIAGGGEWPDPNTRPAQPDTSDSSGGDEPAGERQPPAR